MKNILLAIFMLLMLSCISLSSCNDIQEKSIPAPHRTEEHTSIAGEEDIILFYEQNEYPYKEEQPYTFIVNKYLDLANNYFGEVTPPYDIINPVTYSKELTFLYHYEALNDSCEMVDIGATPIDSYFDYLYEMMCDEMNQMPVIQRYIEIADSLAEADNGEPWEIEEDEPTITIGGEVYSKLFLLYVYENNLVLPYEIEDEYIDENETFEPTPLEELEADIEFDDTIMHISPRRVLKNQWVALWPRKIRYRNYKGKCPDMSLMQSCMQQWSLADNNYIYFSQIADNGWNRFTWGIGCNYHLCLSVETDANCAGSASVGCVPWAVIKMNHSAYERSYLHELGHVLCLEHEIKRADRDLYINVHYDRIKKGYKSNFWKSSTFSALPLGYFDFESIMMYGPYAFSMPGYGQTIERIDGNPYYDLGNTLSEDDKRCIKIIYHP